MRNSTLMCQKLLVQLQTIPAISRQSSNATRLARTATKRNMTWVRNQWRSWMLATSSTRNGRRIATSSRHVRCASHTLNLVATADTDPGKIGNQQYSQMYHMTTGKCQSLWNLVNRSPKASDAVPQLCPSTAVLSPCPTSWNLWYSPQASWIWLQTCTDVSRTAAAEAKPLQWF